MKNIRTKKLIFGGLSTVCLLALLTFSVYTWFYFPMTQYTRVFTDSVINAEVKAEVYMKSKKNFVGTVDADEDNVLSLNFFSDDGEQVNPYFFLWAGDYTTNDNYKTIYRVTVNYSNADGAFPRYLDLYGNFRFKFICYGDNGQPIEIRYMKLSYYCPENQNINNLSYLTDTNYTELDSGYGYKLESPGYEIRLGGLVSSGSTMKYEMFFYLMLETDIDTLNANAWKLEDEYGLLNAEFIADVRLFFRTAPANT